MNATACGSWTIPLDRYFTLELQRCTVHSARFVSATSDMLVVEYLAPRGRRVNYQAKIEEIVGIEYEVEDAGDVIQRMWETPS